MARARPAIDAGRLLDARALAILAAPVLVAAGALAVAAAPVTVGLLAVVAGALALAWQRPEWALAAAVLLFGIEGSIKLLLGLEPTPIPIDNRGLGAGALDLVLFAAVFGLMAADRLRTPRALWARAGRGGRVVIVLLSAWLALSVLQIPQGGDLSKGLEGFRLFHAYVLVAVAAAVVFAGRGSALRPVRVALAIGFAVSLYAAVRVVIGPAFEEAVFTDLGTRSKDAYGTSLRAVGSFSSAVGLQSFLTPLCAFALVAGYLEPRLRVLAWPTAALALVGLGGAYGRAPLMAMGLALAVAVGVLVASADVPRRRRLAAGALSVAVLAAMYGGIEAAGRGSPELDARASGVLAPLSDDSVTERLETWGETLTVLSSDPLGHGIGAVGAASTTETGRRTTTDNSFLKVAVEQGFVVAALFVAGLLGAVVLLGARLRRLSGERRSIGLAALAGFVSYLALATTGEYVEQPGKVVAWGLLGVAAAQAIGRPGGAGDRPPQPRHARRGPPRAVWAAVTVVMVVLPVGLTLGRESSWTASTQILPQRTGPLPAVRDPAYYHALLPALTPWMGGEGLGPWDYAGAEFEAGPRGSVVVSLTASSAARAERILDALSRQLVRASQREVGEEAAALARGAEGRLGRRLRELATAPSPRIVAGRPAVTPDPDRWADRAAAALPGELPGRPSPVWAGLAGGLVAGVAWGVAALTRRRAAWSP
jgi:hypothetical protein